MASDGAFIEPPPFGAVGNYSDMRSYGIDSTVKLEWTLPSDVTATDLWLIQDNVPGAICQVLGWANTTCVLILTGNRGASWDWPLNEPSQYSVSSPIYWLSMLNADDDSRLFGSHYFQILPQNLIASSSPASSTTASATTSQGPSMATSITTTQGPPTTSASTQPQQTNSSDSSGTTKIAIGIAVGVGIPLIAALVAIAYFLYKSQKRKRTTISAQNAAGQVQPSFQEKSSAASTQNYFTKHNAYSHDVQRPSEMPETERPQPPHGVPVELESRSSHN